ARPSLPVWRTWRRYIPVMPARARAAMIILAQLRISGAVVATGATVMGGCLTWTAMKIAPATAALMPASRVRLLVVTVMVGSLSLGGRAASGDVATLGTGAV